MPRRGRSGGSDAAGCQTASSINMGGSADVKSLTGTSSDTSKTEIILGPDVDEIARIAYQLWQNKGCPVGLDQADWFRAEAMLRDGSAATGEDASKGLSLSGGRTRRDYEVAAEYQWIGHWEVWESEWTIAHWVADKTIKGSAAASAL